MVEQVTVDSLRCESLKNPLGIDIKQPRLSWKLQSAQQGVMQSAYQVVMRSPFGVVWDSGKVMSEASVHVPYGGVALSSRLRYTWRVRVWDERDEQSAWSEMAWWEMGLLDANEWQANWIEPQQKPTKPEPPIHMFQNLGNVSPEADADYSRLNPCQYVRRPFFTSTLIKKARLYATAHGVYRCFVNGERVGDVELAPEVTAYDDYLQYQTYDVTELVREGENVLGAIVGDGWYCGRLGLPGDSCQYGDKLALLWQLELEDENGRIQTITSDERCKSNTGSLVYSDLFIGERYDARLALGDWHMPDFDDSAWQPVTIAQHGYDNLVAQYGEPIRIVAEIAPRAILTTPNGETVLDFGQNMHGKVRMQVTGAAGTEITLDYAEMLDEDGNILHKIRGRNKDQRDVYVCRGDGVELYEPLFTTHGFRYVRLCGYPSAPQPKDFTALVVASDLATTGHFECSDGQLNQLWHNIVWSQRGNFVSIPTDCPQREKAGFTGDAQIFAQTAVFNMNVQPFLTRWLRNLQVEQRDDGQVPVIVPYWKSYIEIANQIQGGSHTSAGWGDACVIVPWALYQAYGDTAVLAENYTAMTRWLDYVQQQAASEGNRYLWNTGFHFGDWLMPSLTANYQNPFKASEMTKEIVASCFYGYSTSLMAQIAAVLGNEADRARYTALHEKIRAAFMAEYVRENGRLPSHYQGLYVLALQMGMVREDLRPLLTRHLVDLIAENGYRLDTGFVSMPYLLDVLCDNGQQEVAYKLLWQKECPSWLYQVERGATTIWESWDAIAADGTVNMASFNHYAFGCVGDWLVRHIAGLDKAATGYKQIIIKPHPTDRLKSAKATYESVYGTVESAWQVQDGTLHLQVTIPPNTTAVIHPPNNAEPHHVGSGRYQFGFRGI